ncbi:30S ribosomal protein S12 methylthiotransferase RimO [Oscillospiraceae bacterium DSM 107454]|uniref:Ribosomal protein uS12 methylthiotransferase RimO n=1 Tax=Ructibacterium gallinarum TaxID=2779355 RepID=A0A9D5LYU1_9FIRM|nr:30S ribosomal protein S12 methylthiotransferase RimO [Ructibacterium gallinarum]
MSKVALVSLGCSKNLIDSEQMLRLLEQEGYEIVEQEEDAEILIVNTCTFIEPAKMESIECILELAQYKKSGKCRYLVVTGCMAERYREQVLREIPEADAVIGTNGFDRIGQILRSLEQGKTQQVFCPAEPLLCEASRRRTTPDYTAYIRIAEGCDNHCTYCVIPSIRGPYRSRQREDILKEAEQMAAEGVKELVVVAQDTTRYGYDLYGRYCLPELLRALCAIDGVQWVRVHYCYPELVTDELISVFAQEEKLCSYFDIPIQHISDRILKRMGRRTSKAQITSLIQKIRAQVPGAILRTSLIVGFPGETEAEFEELIEFVRQTGFERLGVFAYSREEDTPAWGMEDQIEEEEKQRRQETLMLVQSEISARWGESRIGSTVQVLTEGRDEIVKRWYGRTYADSIEIDGKVFFTCDRALKEGEFVNVKVEQAMEYDLFGRAEEE